MSKRTLNEILDFVEWGLVRSENSRWRRWRSQPRRSHLRCRLSSTLRPPQLSAYLYTRNCSQLLASLLPTRMLTPASILSFDHILDVDSPELQQYSEKLRATYTPHALLMHAMTINGLWRNACALGVFDDQLWEVLDLAWDAVLGALGWTEGGAEATSSPS